MCQRVQSEWAHLQQLMVATLLDDAPGVVAAHAEPGSGRSIAATLATVEVYFKIQYTSDSYVLLQNDLDQGLQRFFGVSEVS